jgi:hypothetical protein
MAGEKKIEQSEPVEVELESNISTKLSEVEVASGKDVKSSLNPVDKKTTSAIQDLVSDQSAYYPPYSYYYPTTGYNSHTGNYTPSTGAYADYYGYNPYMNFSGIDGSGYFQSYGSDAMLPSYSWDSSYVGDYRNGGMKSTARSAYVNANGFNSVKTGDAKISTDIKSRQSSTPLSKPIIHTQLLKPLDKMSPSYHSTNLMNSFSSVGRYPSSYTNSSRGYFGQLNYRPNSRVWSGNDRFRMGEKFNRNGDFEASNELTRGPRVQNQKNLVTKQSTEEEQKLLGNSVQRDLINLEAFKTEYDDAKFYVIKSYSEDDVHKCIKYEVWSSTPNGNKRLDAAYNDAQAKLSESGKKIPIFLFFSVNRSGQFVGVAEMIGPFDFGKNMDFWQMDKWTGFFPVKWHIIKDLPNSQLRHIILENNDNRDVTYTRDTQEVQLKQGLEMLNIFKNHSEKTTMLDDFDFYEKRENLLRAKRMTKNTTNEEISKGSCDPSSLVNVTENLSLNPVTN